MPRKTPALPNAADQDDRDSGYAIDRRMSNDNADAPYWRVSLKRQGQLLERSFAETTYGGREEARAMAMAWRDAILDAVPPRTNADAMKRPARGTATGYTGVVEVKSANGKVIGYRAVLNNLGVLRYKEFYFSRYGEPATLARAIAQREEWLYDIIVAFVTQNETANEQAESTFPELLIPTPEPTVLDAEEVARRVAEVDARFDALRPLWLVIAVGKGRRRDFWVYVSDSGRPARKQVTTIGLRGAPLGLALAKSRRWIGATIGALFGPALRNAFLAVHGSAFRPETFDLERGFRARLRVADLTRAAAGLLSESARLGEEDLADEEWVDPDAGRAKSKKQRPFRRRAPVSGEDAYICRGDNQAGKGCWSVLISRGGRFASRVFSDEAYGGARNAHALSMAWRDEVDALMPPRLTKRERSSIVYRGNKSGAAGVCLIGRNGGLPHAWRATLYNSRTMRRQADFKIAEHGYEEAKALAIRQRQSWLEAMPGERATGGQREGAMPAGPELDAKAFAEALALINQRYDARLSPRISLRLTLGEHRGRPVLKLVVSEGRKTGPHRQTICQAPPEQLAASLAAMRDKAVTFVTELYGADVAASFLAAHGACFTPKAFDSDAGLSIRYHLPAETAR